MLENRIVFAVQTFVLVYSTSIMFLTLVLMALVTLAVLVQLRGRGLDELPLP